MQGRKMGYYSIEVDGKTVELPSVTTILKVIDKPALMQWAARQAAKAVLTDPIKYNTPERAASAIYSISDVATSRGSDAHKVAEVYAGAYALGKIREFDEIIASNPFVRDNPYLPAIRAFFETMRPEVIHKEVRLVNLGQGYAGTADLVARIGQKSYVVDYKTSKAVYPEMKLQIEAYRQATLIVLPDGTRIGQHPIADAGAVVLLRDDGTFSWVESSADHTAFLAALILFRWRETQS